MKYLLAVTLLSWVLLFIVGKAAWFDGMYGSWIARTPAAILLIVTPLLTATYCFAALWLHRFL